MIKLNTRKNIFDYESIFGNRKTKIFSEKIRQKNVLVAELYVIIDQFFYCNLDVFSILNSDFLSKI